MNDDELQNQTSEAPEAGIKGKIQAAIERFKELPPKVQILIGGVFLILAFSLFSGMGENPYRRPPAPQPTTSDAAGSALRGTARNDVTPEQEAFSTLEQNRQSLQRGFFEEQRRIISGRLDDFDERIGKMESLVERDAESRNKWSREMSQMQEQLTEQIKIMTEQNRRQEDEMRRMVDESRQRDLKQPVGGPGVVQPGMVDGQAPRKIRKRISQTPLSSVGDINVPSDNAILGGVVGKAGGGRGGGGKTAGEQVVLEEFEEPKPFIPPLGFVRGTLLNGFDALAGSGQATPALVRLSGVYKTAMNSTVSLNGCFVLAEFEGDISTERAVGKPSRMTCVYPDRGAVTYDVTGYVVDEKDGIVGIPGVFYEGDASRIAASMLADFAAGVADIIESNQSTFSTDSSGNAQQVLTGSQTKAEIAGGAGKAVKSLRDYLAERASRVVPFIRVDTTRELHLVFLSGVELRHQGSPWTLLFEGGRKDQLDAVKKQRLREVQAQQQ